jgi:thymidylate synthase (FAD)
LKNREKNNMKIAKQSVELLACTPDALLLIEKAGRTCYKSEAKITAESAEAFVRTILKSGHESVIEHASATFRIVCDRGISHEIVRHRLASYSQESTRYCNYGKKGGEITVIMPENLAFGQGRGSWEAAVVAAEHSYLKMLECGCLPQIARSVLPTCLKTELVMTANFREWRHFIRMRSAKAAHPQVQEIARMILRWFDENYPVIVEDLKGAK